MNSRGHPTGDSRGHVANQRAHVRSQRCGRPVRCRLVQVQKRRPLARDDSTKVLEYRRDASMQDVASLEAPHESRRSGE
jgi:hypothetical protein